MQENPQPEKRSRLSKIQHSTPNIGQPEPAPPPAPSKPASLDPEPVQMADVSGPTAVPKQITAFGKEKRHEEEWSRTPNANDTGAIHIKTFHSKLTDDALAYMDRQINEWLDAHPEYEVKFASSTVGILSGKVREPHVICNVWV